MFDTASHFWVIKMHCKLQNAVCLGRALEEVKSITTNDLNSLNGRQNEHTRANSFFRRDIGNELWKALMSGFSPLLSRFEAICNWNAKIRKFIKKNFLSVPIVRVFFLQSGLPSLDWKCKWWTNNSKPVNWRLIYSRRKRFLSLHSSLQRNCCKCMKAGRWHVRLVSSVVYVCQTQTSLEYFKRIIFVTELTYHQCDTRWPVDLCALPIIA